MARLARCGISLDSRLLHRFDAVIRKRGYANRSEAIRDLIRGQLVEEEWRAGGSETVAVVSLVFDHDELDLPGGLTDVQHEHHSCVASTMHIHLDRHNCLEVLVLRGKDTAIKALGERLVSTKGVGHGKLTLTTTGRNLA